MNKRIDFSNLGGYPVTQNTLAFMQDSYRSAFSAIARLAGDKTIIAGVDVTSGNVSSGWISYNSELIPFLGGPVGTDVVVTEQSVSLTFQDSLVHEVNFTKVAQCGVSGDFPFADLTKLSSLANIWLPGDIKEKYCTMQYYTDNFDVDGYGLNKEKGWRLLSKAVSNTAGKVFVNLDTTDSDFNTIGKTGGEKKHTLSQNEFSHSVSIPRGDAYTGNAYQSDGRTGGGQGGNPQSPVVVKIGNSNGVVDGHNNLQPYFVVLKLIKL